MAQAPKRFGDPEVAFVFIPDDADGAAVPLPSSDPVRLRARLVPNHRPHDTHPHRRPRHDGPSPAIDPGIEKAAPNVDLPPSTEHGA